MLKCKVICHAVLRRCFEILEILHLRLLRISPQHRYIVQPQFRRFLPSFFVVFYSPNEIYISLVWSFQILFFFVTFFFAFCFHSSIFLFCFSLHIIFFLHIIYCILLCLSSTFFLAVFCLTPLTFFVVSCLLLTCLLGLLSFTSYWS